MSKSKSKRTEKPSLGEDLRLSPEKRLCNKFDNTSVAEFRVASKRTMGVRVVDNCAEEHIM